MIAKNAFLEQINRLTTTFGSAAFTPERIKAIHSVAVRYPDKWLADIVSIMITTMKYPPLPIDFTQAFSSKSRALNTYEDVRTDYKIQCLDCYETGYVFCKLNDKEPETLSFCHCKHGENSSNMKPQSITPRWVKNEFDKVFGFIKLPFPVENFKPGDDISIEEIISGEFSTVNWWKKTINKAEEYWLETNKRAKGSP